MKKIFTLCTIACAVFGLRAQSNMNMESWSSLTGTESPDNWESMNMLFDFGFADSPMVLKTTAAYSGNYAARIRPVMVDFGGFPFAMPGLMSQLYATTARPANMKFAYKYSTPNSDSAMAAIYFYKGNTSDTGNIVGQAFMFLGPKSTYTLITMPITWLNANTPDTAYISFTSGMGGQNSWFTVDDVSVGSGSASVAELCNPSIKVYVDAGRNLQVEGRESNPSRINLYDNSGRLVQGFALQAGTSTVSLALLKPGIYFYEILTNGSRESGKLLLE